MYDRLYPALMLTGFLVGRTFIPAELGMAEQISYWVACWFTVNKISGESALKIALALQGVAKR